MATNITFEAPGDTIEFAVVLSWYRKPGEQVAEGDPIVEIEADKATYDVCAPVSGVLIEILAVDGDEVTVGATLGVIEEG